MGSINWIQILIGIAIGFLVLPKVMGGMKKAA